MIAIDPGASGGIAWMDNDGIIHAEYMPDGMSEQVDLIRWLKVQGHGSAVIENVGGYMPGNSATAAVKFARHCGHIEAACYCFGVAIEYVAPQTWMKGIGTFSKDKIERKRQIKEAMARRYPHIKVTLKNADALGLFTHIINRSK